MEGLFCYSDVNYERKGRGCVVVEELGGWGKCASHGLLLLEGVRASTWL